jgi:uncharacterized protein (DUF433 family)
MSQTISLRVPDQLADRLDRFARRLGNATTRSRAGLILIDEALREEEFSGIEFRSTIIGRQAFVADTGLTVWELIMVAQAYNLDPDKTAEHLSISLRQVKAGLDYYAAYPDEIDLALADNRSYDEEKLRRNFPNLDVIKVDLSDPAEI